jgi:peptide/nickel transport system permease protein
MTGIEENNPTAVTTNQAWQKDLERVGLLRRILRARRWYGADWWLVAISSVMVLIFIIMALFPGLFAPYNPDQIVGTSFLAPGVHPSMPVLVVPVGSKVHSFLDLASPISSSTVPGVAVVEGGDASTALRETAENLNNTLTSEKSSLQVFPNIDRYPTVDEVLQAVQNGTDDAAVVQTDEYKPLASLYPGLHAVTDVPGITATSGGFLLGTNDVGQDVFSRLIWGARVAIEIGFSSAILALLLGLPLGLLAGYFGGVGDRLLSLLMDSLYAFPGLILAIAITAVLGPSIYNVIAAIAVLYIPTYYRIVRGQTLQVKEEVFIEAARSIGARRWEILGRYIAPNVLPSVAIIFSVNVADAILTGAGLSFLGLGLPPTIADWGIDLATGQRFIQNAWWMITFPGLAIMLVVLAFTMMGEGLMEIYNPKLRER